MSKHFKELFLLENTFGEISHTDAYDLGPVQVQFQMFSEGFISLVGVRKVDNVILLKDLPPLTSLIPILEFCFKKSRLPHLVGLGIFSFLIPSHLSVLLERLWGPWAT